MTAWTEEQRAVFVSERRVVGIHCKRVGRGFLLRERDVQALIVGLFVLRSLLGHLVFKELQMVVRHREVNICLAIRCRIESRLNEMLFQRRARLVGIVVEKQQPFGQIAIVQPFFAQQMRHNLLITASRFQVANTALRVGLAAFAKLFPKCEQLCIVKKLFLKGVCGLVVGRIEKREEVFEHPTSRSRRRNKLHNLAAFGLITLPFGQKRVAFCCRWSHNSIAY